MSQKYDFKNLPSCIKQEAENIFNDMKKYDFLCGKKPIIEDAITVALYNFYKKKIIRDSIITINYNQNCIELYNNVIKLPEVEYCKEDNCEGYNYCYNFDNQEYIIIFKGEKYLLSQIHIHNKKKHVYKKKDIKSQNKNNENLNNFISMENFEFQKYNKLENSKNTNIELHMIYKKYNNIENKILLSFPIDVNINCSKDNIDILFVNILCKSFNQKVVRENFNIENIKNRIYNYNNLYFYTFEENNIGIFVNDPLCIKKNTFSLWENNVKIISDEERFNTFDLHPIIFA